MTNPIAVPESIEQTDMKYVAPVRGQFNKSNVSALLEAHYKPEQVEQMHDAGVDQRMVFGINPYYNALVQGTGFKDEAGTEILPVMPPSAPLNALVIPIQAEADDMSGEKDPSNQQRYSPDVLKGKLLHKYDDIVLGYCALACSAHCRYCYRLDLFNRTTGKTLLKAEELRDYVTEYNANWKANGGVDPETGEQRYPIREVLLSGGDPMVLSNTNLYKYMSAAAEGGASVIRIGSKELAFRPMRFDEKFIAMLEAFHETFPDVHVNLVGHFSHPDEFLLRDVQGNYIQEGPTVYKWLPVVEEAVRRMKTLNFVSIENQTPIIRRVNDDVEAMHLLHAELRRMNIKPKYIFQCRDIEGHDAFAVPLEEAWRIHRDAQRGLSDTARSRFAMSAERGKMEILSVMEPMPKETLEALTPAQREVLEPILGQGLVMFKVHRSPHSASSQGDIVIARSNPTATWFGDYVDDILYDACADDAEQYTGLLAILGLVEGLKAVA